jgi:hypothetical protein
VTVTGPGGTSAVIKTKYEYDPVVKSLSPTSGTGSGGHRQDHRPELSGRNGGPLRIKRRNPRRRVADRHVLDCDGTGRDGRGRRHLTSPSGTSAVIKTKYTYKLPALTAIKPKIGPPAGGTVVTLTGQKLQGVSAVNFGVNPATTFTVDSKGTTVTATSPAGLGAVNVTVTTPGGTSSASPRVVFTYT